MRVYIPSLYDNNAELYREERNIRLEEIVPSVGDTLYAIFDKNDAFFVGEKIKFIWTPALSELNGWDAQPSEIAISYFLEGEIIEISGYDFKNSVNGSEGNIQHLVKVISQERFLPAIKNLELGAEEFLLPRFDIQCWEEIKNYLYYEIEDVIYLYGSSDETVMEIIVEYTSQGLYQLFCLEYNPVQNLAYVGRVKLGDKEASAIEKSLLVATVASDLMSQYIVD